MTQKKKKSIFTANAVRMIIFLCLCAASVLICAHFLGFADAEHSDTIMKEFYQQDEDTVDVIYFGTSATQRAYVIPETFHDHGVAAYSMACGTQPFVLTKYLMQEALKTQTPDLFIVELRGTCQTKDSIWDVAVRRMLDSMKMSSTKRDAIKAVIAYSEGGENSIDTSGWSYYFPFLKFHGRWNPSKQPKYFDNIDYYKGYTLDHGVCFKVRPIDSIPATDIESKIAPETEDVLTDLLDYCDTIDTKVLFVISPYECTKYGMERLNYSQAIVEERGYECLNFLSPEKKEMLGLHDESCYYNREHLNVYGSRMYTEYLTNYIQSNYGVPDRRGDSKYDSWEHEYERLMKNYDTVYAEKYAKMMKKVRKNEAKAKAKAKAEETEKAEAKED